MDPLSLTASLIAVAQVTVAIVDTCYKWKSAVRNSSKQASKIVQQLDSLRSILERLIDIVENESPGSTRLSALSSLSQKGGPLDTCTQGLTELQLQLQPKAGWRAIGGALAWPLKEDETRKVLQGLNDMKTTLHFALDIDHTALALQMHSGIKSLTILTDSIKNDEYRHEIRSWLAAPDPFPSHNAARKKRQPSTGMWFVNSRLFTKWLHASSDMLWLHGIPGCGKSVLFSTTIERLYSITQQSSSAAVAYFYFDFRNFGNSTVEALIRSLIVQLFNQSSEIPSELDVLRNQYKDNNKPPLSKFMELLSLLVHHFKSTYFVIDALDECEEVDGLLITLGEFQNWNSDHLHILVSSRQQREIDEFMATARVNTLCIDESSTGDDINMYIKDQLHSGKFSKWAEDVQLQIYQVLSDDANGMFRWVACQLDMLRSSPTLKSLRRDLRSLPKSLDETYERILLHIPEGYMSYASRILSWLSSATRPMSIEEVAEMLAVDLSSEPYYDVENRLVDSRDVLLMCSSLVTTFTATLGDLYPEMGDNEIYDHVRAYDTTTETQWLRLAHLSVKDYLLSQRIKSSQASFFSIDTRIANDIMAQTCLAYLLLPAFEDGPCGRSSLRSKFGEWPLLSYCFKFLPYHITTLGPLGNETWTLISRFFSTKFLPNGGNYAAWIEMLVPDSAQAYQTDPMYYAASYGMYNVVKRLLEENPSMDIEAKGGRYNSSALQVAVYRGHNEVAKLLIDAGANVNDQNNLDESVLLWTHLKNAPEIQTLLEERGATLSEREKRKIRYLSSVFDLTHSE